MKTNRKNYYEMSYVFKQSVSMYQRRLLVTFILAGVFSLFTFLLHSCAGGSSKPDHNWVSPGGLIATVIVEIAAPPADLNLDTFYKKYLDASGIPIIGSDKVPDEAFFAVQKIVDKMMSLRKDVLAKMIDHTIRIGIMAKSEVTKDMPEYRTLEEDAASGRLWNDCRGVGATVDIPLSSCAEENILCYGPGHDSYYREDITIHEFAHGIHGLGIVFVDPGFDEELQQALDDAKEQGLWKNTYASSNIQEYFAEGVQCWFNINDEASPSNGIHNEINTREELKNYDPALYKIIKRYFPEDNDEISCHKKG